MGDRQNKAPVLSGFRVPHWFQKGPVNDPENPISFN